MPIWDYLERQAEANRPKPYTVQEGDSWLGIAQQNKVDYNALLGYNPQVGNTLVPGTIINVPTPSQTQGYSLEDIRNLMQQGPGMGFGQNTPGAAPVIGTSFGARNRNVDNPLLTMNPIERARQQMQWAGRFIPSMQVQQANPNLNTPPMSAVRTAKTTYGAVPQNVGAPTVPLPGMTVQQSMINRMRSTPFLSRNDEVLVGKGTYTGSIAPGYNEWGISGRTVRWPNTPVKSKSGGGYSRRGGGWGGWGGGWGGQSSRQWQGIGLVNWRM